ncbi:acyltransferase [Pseudokordiimonas caeni]|uniref:acyltransferase n=1 Tax=Pseudokordiimonas caeni TaxID=2997908 RepID=UPI002812697F|nr:acyltransferase [Pseudokordiimonas caeni]
MKRRVRPEHIAMLVRGLIWQVLHLRFDAIILKGRGARIWIDRKVKLQGIVKIGDFAKLDLRYTAKGIIRSGFSLGDYSIFRASGSPAFTCQNVEIDENVTFGPYCNIGGGFGLVIGADVIAGPYVSVHPEEHGLATDRPVREQAIRGRGIRIGNDCWLGAKSTVLDGSDLADGTVLGANTVLAGAQTDANCIYVGIPARFLRQREMADEGTPV